MADISLTQEVSAAGRYAELEQDRQGFLTRGRECAALTIPSILPPQGFSPTAKLPTPYQSLGARGVRTLASKFALSLFPGIPFFNYQMDDTTIEKLGEKRGEMDTALARRERAVTHELDTSVFRPVAFLTFLHLLVGGNALLRIPVKQEERAQMWRLDQYVTRRNAAGRLLEFVIKEPTDYASLPDSVREQINTLPTFKEGEKVDLKKQPLELYTHGYWDHPTQRWVVYQEAAGIRLPDSVGTYKEGELEYLALRFSSQPGEHYGRSYVEEYLGDLDSLEALSETLVEGTAASARIVFMVNPGGVTQLKVVAEAKNGDVVSGDAEDVSTLQAQKQADLQVAKSQAEEIATRLSYAFLLHSSIQRSGERVTAEEIRYMASELDDGLGGVYTFLAADLQLPSVRLFERRMEKRLGADTLPKGMVQPVVVTGLEAIGRGHNQKNLQAFVKEIVGTLTPEVAMRYLKPLELIQRAAAAYSIDTTNLIPSEDEVKQAEQQAQLQALIQHLGPQALQQLGGMGNTMIKGQQETNVQ
jgi:hypothetical protein